MNDVITTFLHLFCTAFCQENGYEKARQEIFNVEKSFEKMCKEKGIAEAFYFFADDNAVIKRQNDTLISGKENIRDFYSSDVYVNASVSWTPDYIYLSELADLAYTYGKYTWKFPDEKGDAIVFKGVFHTIWKRQPDKSWKYVWD
jgi:ketosteroid isomerase-like protein